MICRLRGRLADRRIKLSRLLVHMLRGSHPEQDWWQPITAVGLPYLQNSRWKPKHAGPLSYCPRLSVQTVPSGTCACTPTIWISDGTLCPVFVDVEALGHDLVMQVCVTETNWHAVSSHLAVGPSQHAATGLCALRAATVYCRRMHICLDEGRLAILRTLL